MGFFSFFFGGNKKPARQQWPQDRFVPPPPPPASAHTHRRKPRYVIGPNRKVFYPQPNGTYQADDGAVINSVILQGLLADGEVGGYRAVETLPADLVRHPQPPSMGHGVPVFDAHAHHRHDHGLHHRHEPAHTPSGFDSSPSLGGGSDTGGGSSGGGDSGGGGGSF